MRYKVKWRLGSEGPLAPEAFDAVDAARARVRQLIGQHGSGLVVDVWNEDETWQIVSPAGIAEWIQ